MNTTPTAVTADPSLLSWLGRLAQLRAEKKALGDAEAQVLGKIREATRGAEAIVDKDGVILAKDRERVSRRLDTAMIRALYPQIAAECTVESHSRTFTFEEAWGNE